MGKGEGRLSRWSRLKGKGGADAREEAVVDRDRTAPTEVVDGFPGAADLPGGIRQRVRVAAMAPLAPMPEEGDDRLTRGVGYVEKVDDADAGPDARVAAIDNPDDLFAGIEEEALTAEQQKIVADLPAIETLTKDSDFTPFLNDGVPEFIKRRALRVLWRSDPSFGFRDGLNEYDQDFNVIHKIIDSLTGNYQVGRGHLSEKELQDMMPEEARRAFDEEETEEEIADDDAADEVDVAAVDSGPEEASDDIGDGEDEPRG